MKVNAVIPVKYPKIFNDSEGIVNQNLITEYRVDKGDGQILWDYSSYKNNGILGSSSGSDINDPTWTNKGLNFTTDDYVTLNTDTWNSFNKGTIYAVINIPSLPTVSATFTLFGLGSATDVNAFMGFGLYGLSGTDTRLRHGTNLTTMDYVYGDTSLNINTNYLITIKSDGNSWTIKIGTRKEILTIQFGSNSGRWFSQIVSGSMRYSLGTIQRSTGNIAYFNGLILFNAIYNRFTSDAEDIQNYNYIKRLLTIKGINLS